MSFLGSVVYYVCKRIHNGVKLMENKLQVLLIRKLRSYAFCKEGL